MSDTSVSYKEASLAHAVQRLCEPDMAREARREVNIAAAVGAGVVMTLGTLVIAKLSVAMFIAICVWTVGAVAFYWVGSAPFALVGLGSVAAMFEGAHRTMMDDFTSIARTMGLAHTR